ncbi:putative esterase [Roseibium hamelinense]|uniref:Putative esterase n=1 Tax=Roseibium hamelinense TaxID=150831 RepID=A0A562TJX7_9HYPH|nr:alpha/beta hydrolase-fold protein [Roseibium hamelinense]MTI45667.1 enterochelin esterase [Roseibium hamelinense]TWI93150.1 putative esterase [Roseibium hamelinense]
MRAQPDIPSGEIHRFTISSDMLKTNRLGDPYVREIAVYIPHGETGDGLPLLVDLVGFTSGGPAHTNWKNFGENVPERADRLIHEGKMPPVAIAFPDCFTRLGGNQYIDSLAMGPWATWLTTEMLAAVEGRFKCGGPGRRGVFGKSSGGYGSMVHAMLHADTWSAAACHSGDMAFELCYLPEMPSAVRAIARKGSIETFVTDFETGPKYPGGAFHDLMTFAMAATYDPDPDPDTFCGIRLPVDLETCEINDERWSAWLAWDPVLMADKHTQALKSLKGLWIDCGSVDQYNLVYGARRLHKKLQGEGVDHVYEEFDDNHSSVDYRMDDSLPFLAKALTT